MCNVILCNLSEDQSRVSTSLDFFFVVNVEMLFFFRRVSPFIDEKN